MLYPIAILNAIQGFAEYGEEKIPYYISSEGKEKGVYIRTSGSTRPADAVQIKELEFEGANR